MFDHLARALHHNAPKCDRFELFRGDQLSNQNSLSAFRNLPNADPMLTKGTKLLSDWLFDFLVSSLSAARLRANEINKYGCRREGFFSIVPKFVVILGGI